MSVKVKYHYFCLKKKKKKTFRGTPCNWCTICALKSQVRSADGRSCGNKFVIGPFLSHQFFLGPLFNHYPLWHDSNDIWVPDGGQTQWQCRFDLLWLCPGRLALSTKRRWKVGAKTYVCSVVHYCLSSASYHLSNITIFRAWYEREVWRNTCWMQRINDLNCSPQAEKFHWTCNEPNYETMK